MPYSKESTARHIKAQMALAGMSVNELADKSGVSKDSIGNYLRGQATPMLDNIFALAEALGCTPNDLCGFPSRGR